MEKSKLIKLLQEKQFNMNDELWVIELNGERLKLSSGKSSWLKERFAKSALTNELKNYVDYRERDKVKSFIDELISFGNLVFKRVL